MMLLKGSIHLIDNCALDSITSHASRTRPTLKLCISDLLASDLLIEARVRVVNAGICGKNAIDIKTHTSMFFGALYKDYLS